MTKTVTDLVNEKCIPVELVKNVIEAFKDGWNGFNGFDFPTNKILVLSLTPNTQNTFSMHFLSNGKETYVTVPKDFELKLLDGDSATNLLKERRDYVAKNLSKELRYHGTIGSDPEIFAENETGQVMPAFQFLGSKENPNIGPDREYCKNNLYWDGFQAEFTTFATSCMGWHSDSIQGGLEGIWKALKAVNNKAKLSAKTVVDIPIEMLRSSAPEHVAFGCMPSLNIYGMSGLDAPGEQVPFRAAGGHIHFGFYPKAVTSPTTTPTGKPEPKSPETIERMVKALDAILGVAGVSLFASFDDPRRRKMYGLAGEYRLPPHGLEYRVLSNAWLFHPLIANIVFDLGRSALVFGETDLLDLWKGSVSETVETINNCDVTKAREILKRNEVVFRELINARYLNRDKTDFVFNVIMNGMESVIETPTDIEKNWNLGDAWNTHCSGVGKNVQMAYALKKKCA